MKSKIEEILYKHSERIGLYEGGVITCIDENEFDEIAEEVVKLFTIPVVSNPCRYHNTTNDELCVTCGDTYKNKAT